MAVRLFAPTPSFPFLKRVAVCTRWETPAIVIEVNARARSLAWILPAPASRTISVAADPRGMATAPPSSTTFEATTAENVCPADAVLELISALFLIEIGVPLGIVAMRCSGSGAGCGADAGVLGAFEAWRGGARCLSVDAVSTYPKRMLWISRESRVRVAPLLPRNVICEPFFETSAP